MIDSCGSVHNCHIDDLFRNGYPWLQNSDGQSVAWSFIKNMIISEYCNTSKRSFIIIIVKFTNLPRSNIPAQVVKENVS